MVTCIKEQYIAIRKFYCNLGDLSLPYRQQRKIDQKLTIVCYRKSYASMCQLLHLNAVEFILLVVEFFHA